MKIQSLLKHPIEKFTHDPKIIAERIKAPLTRAERFGLAIAIAVVIGMTLLSHQIGGLPVDYRIYILTAQGELTGYFYPYWLLPLFKLFSFLPPLLGYSLWGIMNILGVLFACRVFGGNTFFVLTSFQLFYTLGNGQIVGVMAFGLALFWWAMVNQRWVAASLGAALAAIKVQSGCFFIFFLWWLAPDSLKNKIKPALVFLVLVGISLAAYPGWPLEVIDRAAGWQHYKANVSLWSWLGAAALVFWLPVFLLRVDRSKAVILLFATTYLTVPYVQHYDLLMLFTLPIGFPYVLAGNLGYFFSGGNWIAIRMLGLIPLAVYLTIVITALIARFQPGKKKKPGDYSSNDSSEAAS